MASRVVKTLVLQAAESAGFEPKHTQLISRSEAIMAWTLTRDISPSIFKVNWMLPHLWSRLTQYISCVKRLFLSTVARIP